MPFCRSAQYAALLRPTGCAHSPSVYATSASAAGWFTLVNFMIISGGDQLCHKAPSACGNVIGTDARPLNEPVSSALMTAFGSVVLAASIACAKTTALAKAFSAE